MQFRNSLRIEPCRNSISKALYLKKTYVIFLFALILIAQGKEVKAQLLINEFVASNESGAYYDSEYEDYPDWLEIYNASDVPIDISYYYLTDELDEPDKWIIPEGTVIAARGYLLFLADDRNIENHTSFKLSADGESIALSNRDKVIVDSVIYMPQNTNISMGRIRENPGVWAYYQEPTPNAMNNTTAYSGMAMAPVLNIPAGFYDLPLTVEIESPSQSAIHYTLDGSSPTPASNLYSGPIEITSNMLVKAIGLEEGKMNSEVITASYFIGEDAALPVFSFSMSPGLASGFPYTSEMLTHVEYFNENHTQVISQDIGARITGLVGIHPMRTFSLYARSEYGKSRLDHRFFQSKSMTSYKNLVLRNGGYQDYSYTYIRDGLIQSFVEGYLDLEYQAYKPVLVFKNGTYHGLMNMREKQNEFYIENNMGVDNDSIDLLEYQTESPIEVLSGDAEHYNAMIDFIENVDLSLQENMDELETRMDVKNYLDYYMLEIYCANADWPDKNCKIWRPRSAEGKWRWMVFDVDYGYGFAFPVETNMYDYLYTLEEPYYHNRPWVTVIFRKIMENEDMRNYYLQRFSALLNTVFHSDRALQLTDSLKAQIEPEIGRHINKWGHQAYGIPTMEEWQSNCDVLYDFANRRPHFARKGMMDFFQLEDTVTVEIESDGGTVYINDFAYCKDSQTGLFFKNIPIQLLAVPDNGFEFVEWINVSDLSKASTTFVPGSDTSISALFAPIYENILGEVFLNDTVLSDVSSPYVARGDLVIPANIHVTIEKGVKILMPEGCNIYVYGILSVNGSEDNPVVIDAYDEKWGAICLNHSTGVSEFNHLILENASTGGDPEIYKGAISAYHADLKLNSVIIENVPVNPIMLQYGNFEVKNGRFQSDGSCDLINIKHADTAIVEYSVFMDSKMDDTDAIDFDDVKVGIIRHNRIHNLIGENSDGIDIGEGTQNVEIYENLISNCSDKGISIGQASSMKVYKNVIFNCYNALAVKDFGSFAEVRNNTLVNNSISISCYEKNLGSGAGSAQVLNTILADSRLSSIVKRDDGEILVDYSISNTDILTGTGNIYGDPELTSPHQFNFQLLSSSPCIDGGSPDTPLDSDGSPADMGAYFVMNWPVIDEDLIINEYYSHDSESDPQDWIEIFNKGESDIDISGWFIKDGSSNYFKISEETRINGESYIVLCKDTSNFRSFFDSGQKLIGNFDFTLGHSRDVISLFNKGYLPVKSFVYDEDFNWPDSNDKTRLSVALIDTSLSMQEGRNWRTGYKEYGTPGYTNIPPRITDLYLNEVSGAEQNEYMDEFGEYDDWLELYNGSDSEVNFGGLFLTDDLNDPTLMRVRQNEPDSTHIQAGDYKVLFADGTPDQGVLHLDFRISANGEELGLVQLLGLDTVMLDHVLFGNLSPGSSYSRLTDGGLLWAHQIPTPGYSNQSSSVVVPEERQITVYPNPASSFINIRLEKGAGGETDIQVVNIMGQMERLSSGIYTEPGHVISLDVSHLEPGIYLVKINTGSVWSVHRIVISR